MMMRRDALKGSGIKQVQFTDDRRIRDFIAASSRTFDFLTLTISHLHIMQNPTFLVESSDTSARTVLDIPLIDYSSRSVNGTPDSTLNTAGILQNDDLASSSDIPGIEGIRGEPPKKKVKGVRFVDDS